MGAKPLLRIHLFGRPEFQRGDVLLPPLATHKTQSLLAFLILHRNQSHSRDKLGALFWGDQDQERARHSLATALWRIRRLLAGDDYLLADTATIQFNPAGDFWLDIAEFEKRLAANRDETRAIDDLRQAVDVYRGDLLEGFYDDWCIEERYRLEALYLDALNWLVAYCEVHHDSATALIYARQYLARDPLQESLHFAAMRALVALGDRVSARQQWQICCEARQRELHAPPSPEMLEQAEDILGAQFVVPLPVIGKEDTAATLRRGTLEQPPFVGRARELNGLLARWEEVKQGKGGVVLISGETGVGKTRLAEELAAVISWRGATVARGHCREPERVIPFQPMTEILRGLLTTNQLCPTFSLPVWALAEIAQLVPDLIAQRKAQPVLPVPSAPLLRAINALVQSISARAPLLILLEDLHWADDSTLAAFDYLARQIPEMHVLIVGTFRPEEVDDAHRLTTIAAQLARDSLAQPRTLEPLTLDAVIELVQRVRADEAISASQLYAHTEGNALFLIETLHDLALAHGADANPAGGLPVPRTVRALIQARYGRLSAPARGLAHSAAVAGYAFDFDVVCSAASMDEEAALEAIDELLQKGFMREGSGSAGRDYEFSHSLMQQVVYAGLHHRRRRRLHRLIGETLEAQCPEQRLEFLGALAHHFDCAGIGKKAVDYAEQAAQRAWSLGAASETEQYCAMALRCLERVGAAAYDERSYRERHFDLLLGREQALDVLGRRAEQAVAQQSLTELAEALNDDTRRAQVHLRRFWFNYPEQLADARREAECALAVAQRQSSPAMRVQALYVLALAHGRSTEPGQGLKYAEAALTQARELGDRVLEGWSLLQLGYLYKQLADLDHARSTLEQSLTMNRAVGNPFAVGRTLIHLGDVRRACGDVEQAHRDYREALALAHEIGYRWVEEDARARLNDSG